MSGPTTLCNRCGRTILFIQMKSGKSMPCDARPVRYIPNPDGRTILYDRSGKRVVGDLTTMETAEAPSAYLPHWGSCIREKGTRKQDAGYARAAKIGRTQEPATAPEQKQEPEPREEQLSLFPKIRTR